MRKKIVALILMMVMLFTLVGCHDCEEYLGPDLEIGFYRRYGTMFWCAAKTDKSIFNVDDVTLDFYFGYNEANPMEDWVMPWLGYEYICNALYFSNADISSASSYLDDYTDYEGCWFVKEISIEEFTTEKYSAKGDSSSFVATIFNHSEKLTVPKDVLAYPGGTFNFRIMTIIYRTDYSNYLLHDIGRLSISYTYIDESTVWLSAAERYRQEGDVYYDIID